MSSVDSSSSQSGTKSRGTATGLFEEIMQVKRTTKGCSGKMSTVPEAIRKLRKSAYTPRLVSIGPLHSDNSRLQPMGDVKKYYVYCLFNRLSQTAPYPQKGADRKVLGDWLQQMKDKLEDAKEHYSLEFSKKLTERMLVIDGCFILEFLYKNYCIKKKIELPVETLDGIDPIFRSSRTRDTVVLDLLLLENQLPFRVLAILFDNSLKKIQNERFPVPPLRELVIQCFGDLLSPEKKGNRTPPAAGEDNKGGGNQHVVSVTDAADQTDEYKHILQLLHGHYIAFKKTDDQPHEETDKKDGDTGGKDHMEFIYSALDLDHAGVKFVTGDKNTDFPTKEDLFKEPEGCIPWCFCSANFRIPTLWIYDSTEILFRNLIAFEQCTPGVPQYFTSYAFLLDKLINTEEDVQVLQKAGVIRHYLGSNEEVSNIVNKLCTEVILRNFYFREACDNIDNYVKKWWPNFMAQLKRKYFSTPWTVVAFVLAFLTFGIQIINFVRSFIR